MEKQHQKKIHKVKKRLHKSFKRADQDIAKDPQTLDQENTGLMSAVTGLIQGVASQVFLQLFTQDHSSQMNRFLSLLSTVSQSQNRTCNVSAIEFFEAVNSKLNQIDFLKSDSLAYQNKLEVSAEVLNCAAKTTSRIVSQVEFLSREHSNDFMDICFEPLMKSSRLYSEFLKTGLLEDMEEFQMQR